MNEIDKIFAVIEPTDEGKDSVFTNKPISKSAPKTIFINQIFDEPAQIVKQEFYTNSLE